MAVRPRIHSASRIRRRSQVSWPLQLMPLESRVTPAVTMTWDPATGHLAVWGENNDSVTMETPGDGTIRLNGAVVTDLSGAGIPDLAVRSLRIEFKGTGNNVCKVNKIDSLTLKQKIVENAVGELRDYEKEPAHVEIPNITIVLGAGDDTFEGSSFGEIVWGGPGADSIKGGRGNDFFVDNFADAIDDLDRDGGQGYDTENLIFTSITPPSQMTVSVD